MRRLTRVLLVCELPVVAVALLMVCGMRLNVSESIPIGLYWQSRLPPTMARGMLVAVHIEGRDLPLAKPIAGLPGDVVCVHIDRELVIRGVSFGPVLETWHGHPLPSAVEADSCVVVPPEHVFLASTHEHSYDSRYFNSVPVAQLEGMLRPVLTW
jgi:type IV secretory pathway protease TraF